MSPRRSVHRGHVLHIAGRATLATAAESLVSIPDAALVVDDAGTVAWVGAHRDLPGEYASWPVTGDASAILLPGFVDTHVHFPQTFSSDGFGGGQLLEWLDRTVFPAETRLADPDFADVVARAFTRRRVRAGTTAAMVFGSAFPAAQDALFERTREAGLRIVSGRGIQTVGPASARGLLTSEEDALALVSDEITRWHTVDTGEATTSLLQVAIVPRFSLSVTPSLLAALGDLYDDVRASGVYVHSHLNENDRPGDGEIAAVLGSYGTRSYLDTYDGLFLPGSARGGSSLLGPRTILAHAVHCQDAELHRMAETGTSIAHCPTSQQFLGSGTMPWRRTAASGVTIALGSDIGAGDEWLLPRVANDAFKVHLSEPGDAAIALHPAELLFTATLAGARALNQEARFGNFDLGKDADFVRIEPRLWEPLADVLAHGIRADDEEEAAAQLLFAVLMTLREPAIAAVHVQGRRVAAPG
ncbi:amidohydrolase family protein [Rathayibacter tanaceti]|uniref:Amidohydrolase family protein n=2 Tax=Rathayibacter tanaceti TaxID=1671680 RepID=A0A166HH75_9MICO|nr:amidohydrolase family protein [Rathayibacter tanaceti]KZX20586.1 Guanine deaminase [Rathayibacter tanaceti]QHC55658.1 amidohydrolase family protein [Rathayibacter tanaceti]TCO39539.1 guanine deaminase [Rathayibacter tanaceti]